MSVLKGTRSFRHSPRRTYSGARGFGARRKPTAKQLAALAKGRRILAQKRKHKK